MLVHAWHHLNTIGGQLYAITFGECRGHAGRFIVDDRREVDFIAQLLDYRLERELVLIGLGFQSTVEATADRSGCATTWVCNHSIG
jgi:hypothetical protein